MDKPFDPPRDPEDTFELGGFEASVVTSDETPFVAPKGFMETLKRQANQYSGLPEKPSSSILPSWLQRKPKPAKPKEKPEKKGFDRRTVMFGGAAAVGVAATASYRVSLLYDANDYKFAIAKKDSEMGVYGLVHRIGNSDGMSEADINARGALTLADDESLVITPSVELEALSRERDPSAQQLRDAEQRSQDRQVMALSGTASNVYIPYHLFANARQFSVTKFMKQESKPWDGPLLPGEREQIINGVRMKVLQHPKLRISIIGIPEAEDLSFVRDAARAAETTGNAIGDVVTDATGGLAGIGDSIAEAVGLGDGVDNAAAAARARDAERIAREQRRSHDQVEPKFIIEMDYIDEAHIPDLHFYNGKTMAAPTDHVLREEIIGALRADGRKGMELITNNGLNCNAMVNGGVCVPQNVRFTDRDLPHSTYEARLHANSAPVDGFGADLLAGIQRIAIHDDKLDTKDRGALLVASTFQQNGYDRRMGEGFHGFINRLRNIATPDTHIGR